MRCTEPPRPAAAGQRAARGAVTLLVAWLASACSPPPDAARPVSAAADGSASGASSAARGEASTGSSPARHPPAAPGGVSAKGPPRRAAQASPDWDDYRRRAAERMVALNPDSTFGGPVPEPLLAIPVLQIELNGDGSVRRIEVLRQPGQAVDTVQLAMAAVRRAAPFAPVSHLARPWVFTETFLFNEQRRFKPRSLDG